jgi:phosphate transport system protein
VQERRLIDDDLDALKLQLAAMGDLAQQRVKAAVDGLLDDDRSVLRDIIEGDKPLNDLQMKVDAACFRLLALHQPVAVDLRFVVAATRLSADLERIGDLAVNIAETGNRYLSHRPVKPLIDINRLSTIAQQMLSTAIHAFLDRIVSPADSVLHWDDQLKELNAEVFRDVLKYMLRDTRTIDAGTDLILISRNLERIGNHATNIAEDAVFVVEAREPRHRGPLTNRA